MYPPSSTLPSIGRMMATIKSAAFVVVLELESHPKR
jgi:hypothetical protein